MLSRIKWFLGALGRLSRLGRELNALHARQAQDAEAAAQRHAELEQALRELNQKRENGERILTERLAQARKVHAEATAALQVELVNTRQDLVAAQALLERLRKWDIEPEDLPLAREFLRRLEATDEAGKARRQASLEEIKQLGYRLNGVEEQIKKDRPVFNRLKDSWLHPDYYYKNIVGLAEDRQRLLHRAIGLLEPGSRVLDIGPGNCFAMEAFLANGHRAEGIGLELESYIPKEVRERYHLIEADYNTFEVDEPYDAIWASHVLEHQPDKHTFVRKMHRDLREGGWLFILVPPMKAEVVGGHLNLFNNGYLIYSLVVGGFDCSQAMVTKYGYNCVVFLRKRSFELPKLRYDEGDIDTLAPYFPFEATQNFNGLHLEVNWTWQ